MGSLVVKGFIASVIGGLGSLTGAVIGALLLGILETILLAALGSGYSTIAVFAVMLVFLLIRSFISELQTLRRKTVAFH